MWRLAIVAVVVIGLSLVSPATWAAIESVATLPAPGVRATSGLQVTVDATWVSGPGYRPVKVTVSPLPPGAAPRDRELRVELWPNSWGPRNGNFCVSARIELPEGSTGATATIPVPEGQAWTNLQVDVYEDSYRLKDLSPSGGPFITNSGQWTEASPAVLVIDAKAPPRDRRRDLLAAYRRTGPYGRSSVAATQQLPDVLLLAALLPDNEYSYDVSAAKQIERAGRIDDMALLGELGDSSQIEMLPPDDLPERWIDYSCFDLVFISLGDLEAMARRYRPQWRAVRAWVAAGGTLCVYDVGEEFEHLGKLEKLLDLPPIHNAADRREAFPGWTAPNPALYGKEVAAFRNIYQSGNVPQIVPAPPDTDASDEENPKPKTPPAAPPDPPTFLVRPCDLGRVVAMGPGDVFPGSALQWQWLLNTLRPQTWMWHRRHGLSMAEGNPDYWNFLIPGVGLAPVNSFRVLITLFVIVIGPVNYIVLRRWRRLNWLVVTIPAGALAVTGALFLYALATDGLGVRVRVRSFTQLDQRTGRAVSWSRQSYYAGLAPSRGLSFPEDAAVYPLDRNDYSRYDGTLPRRRFDWDRGQHLRSGYLASRVTSQFLVVRSRRSEVGLNVRPAAGGSAPTIENRLAAPIAKLLLRDSSGALYWAEDVARGERFRPMPCKIEAARDEMKVACDENRPRVPEGFDPNAVSGNWSLFGPFFWGYMGSGYPSPPKTADSLLEKNLRVVRFLREDRIEPRSYVAVVETSPEVPLGVASAREVAGFHVVVGRW